ncbi:MAG: hypothetical protein WAO23_06330 [Dethiobacteria bacterium]
MCRHLYLLESSEGLFPYFAALVGPRWAIFGGNVYRLLEEIKHD